MPRLCPLYAIPDGGCKGFDDGTATSLFAVRHGGQVHVYRNCCPHAHTPLNWMPDRFLNREKTHIICATHGALFTIATGECVAGPCTGQYLTRIETEVRNGEVWVIRDER